MKTIFSKYVLCLSTASDIRCINAMVGGAVNQVIKSNHPQFSVRDFVLSYNGWHTYSISRGETLRKLDPNQASISYALGVLGMPLGNQKKVKLLLFLPPPVAVTALARLA